jgi:hypothetical protein
MTQHQLYVQLEDSVVVYATLKAVHLSYAGTHRAWVPRYACFGGGRLRTGSLNVSVAQWFVDTTLRGALAKEDYVALQDCRVIRSRRYDVLIARGPAEYNRFTRSVPRLFCWQGKFLACGDTTILVAPAFLERHKLLFLADPAVAAHWAGERPTKWRRFTRSKSKPYRKHPTTLE